MRWLDALGHALTISGSMTWEILWALIFGFALSAVVQAALAALPIVDLTIEEAPLEEVMRELFGAGDKEARTASRANG